MRTDTGNWPYSPWLRGYSYELDHLDGGLFYWHLLWLGERVNGGLEESWEDAVNSARMAAQQHIHIPVTVQPLKITRESLTARRSASG